MPEGYPSREALAAGRWLPVPRERLPFHSVVAVSRNDPLASPDRVLALAADWGSECVDLGAVGHLNPASGYGEWSRADALIEALSRPAGDFVPALRDRKHARFTGDHAI
jgi:predicted alpha/beta hydrolase family esterase